MKHLGSGSGSGHPTPWEPSQAREVPVLDQDHASAKVMARLVTKEPSWMVLGDVLVALPWRVPMRYSKSS